MKFALLILPVVFVSCSTLPGPDEGGMNSGLCIRKGNYYYSRGVLNRAFVMYVRAWRYSGRKSNVYERLGRVCMEMGDRDKALYFFRYSMKFHPCGYRAYMLAARITAGKDPERAALFARKAAVLVPPSLEKDVQKGIDALGARHNEGVFARDTDTAAQAAARGVMKGNLDVLVKAGNRLSMSARKSIFYKAADICLGEEDIESALVILEQIARVRGQSGVYIRMGNICFMHGVYAKAVSMYLRYTEKSDEPGLGYFNTGVVYCAKGFERRGRKMFRKAGPEYRHFAEDILARRRKGEQIRPLVWKEDKQPDRH